MSTLPPSFSASLIVSRRPKLLEPLRERPELLAWELLWRWLCGGLLLAIVAYQSYRIWIVSIPALHSAGLFSISANALLEDPSSLLSAWSACLGVLRPQIVHAALGLAPLAIFCWVAAFAWGRSQVLARYDPRLLRRPWALGTAEALRVCGLVAVSLAWGWLLDLDADATLRGTVPNGFLYILLALGITGVLWFAWRRFAGALREVSARVVVEPVPFTGAFPRAWKTPSAPRTAPLRAVASAAGRARLWLLLAALIMTLLPSPFSSGWPLVAWWSALSLLMLAGAAAVRLGVLFATVQVLREERVQSTAGASEIRH